jgi:hypothetical protein
MGRIKGSVNKLDKNKPESFAASEKQYDHYDALGFKKSLFEACQWVSILRDQMGFDKLPVEDIQEIVRRRCK